MIIIMSSQGGTGQCFSCTDVKIEYKKRISKLPCLEYSAGFPDTTNLLIKVLLTDSDHKEEVHSKCIPPFWQTGTTTCVLFYLSNTAQLGLYVDQKSTINLKVFFTTARISAMWYSQVCTTLLSLVASPTNAFGHMCQGMW